MRRIRVAMNSSVEQQELLHGIVEADETYVGGKPRKGNRHDTDKPFPRGRATSKTPVIGMALWWPWIGSGDSYSARYEPIAHKGHSCFQK